MIENINDLKLDRHTNHVLIAINKIFHGLDWKNRHCSKLTEKNLVKLSLRAKRSNLLKEKRYHLNDSGEA